MECWKQESTLVMQEWELCKNIHKTQS